MNPTWNLKPNIEPKRNLETNANIQPDTNLETETNFETETNMQPETNIQDDFDDIEFHDFVLPEYVTHKTFDEIHVNVPCLTDDEMMKSYKKLGTKLDSIG